MDIDLMDDAADGSRGAPQARVEPVAGDGTIWVMVGRLLPVQGQQSCGLPLGHACESCLIEEKARLDTMLSEILE